MPVENRFSQRAYAVCFAMTPRRQTTRTPLYLCRHPPMGCQRGVSAAHFRHTRLRYAQLRHAQLRRILQARKSKATLRAAGTPPITCCCQAQAESLPRASSAIWLTFFSYTSLPSKSSHISSCPASARRRRAGASIRSGGSWLKAQAAMPRQMTS